VVRKVRILPTGEEIPYGKFERIRRVVYQYYTGRISGAEFEARMRRLGYTRARAYEMYRYIVENLYQIFIDWIRVLVTASLVTTSSKGPSSERYFEGRIFAPVPLELKDDAVPTEVPPLFTCDEVDSVGNLLIKCIYIYFESKGYDVPMLDTAEWKAGVQYLEQFEAPEDMDVEFECEIYDLGSASRPMSIRRWHDIIKMIKKYWEDLPCRHFREEAFKRGYLKEWGKQVRW